MMMCLAILSLSLVSCSSKESDSILNEATEHLNAGMEYQQQENFDSAVVEYDEAIRLLQLELANIYSSRGMVNLEMGQLEAAIQDFDQAITFNPNLSEPLIGRGQAYLGLSQYEQAVQDFTQAIDLEPEDTNLYIELYFQRGHAYLQLQQYEQAVQDFTEAIDLEPEDTNLYDQLESWEYV